MTLPDGVDQIQSGQQIDAEALGEVFQKTFQHIAFNPFLGYNKGKSRGEVSFPLAAWVSP